MCNKPLLLSRQKIPIKKSPSAKLPVRPAADMERQFSPSHTLPQYSTTSWKERTCSLS